MQCNRSKAGTVGANRSISCREKDRLQITTMAYTLPNISSVVAVIVIKIIAMTIFWSYNIPTVEHFEPYCDVVNSSLVRKLVERSWIPVLNRYGVTLPIQCPLNLARDMLGTRELLKRRKSSHWKCQKCGKRFYSERFLDLHIGRKHNNVINKMDDSVCFGSFCDVMRCDILMSTAVFADDFVSTDVSLWTPPLGDFHSDQKTAPLHSAIDGKSPNYTRESGQHKAEAEVEKLGYLQKEDCDEEYFYNLRNKCIGLIWECLQGLISILDAKDFRVIQDELESTSCSYLSCSRYADTHCPRYSRLRGPLRPFLIVFGSLLISLCLALSYYFAWIFTQSPEDQISIPAQDCDTKYDETSLQQRFPTCHNRNLVNRTTHI